MRNFLIYLLLLSCSIVKAQENAKIEKMLQFVKVEGGTFMMGSADYQDATLHKVQISNFYIQKTEITQELWEAVMGNNPSRDKSNKRNPVTDVGLDDCLQFIEKLNSITGKNYRLPTESEWEFAARGGNLSKGYKYSGSNDLNKVAFNLSNCNKISQVAKKKSNELGLYDMSGNASEWCSDIYDYYPEDEIVVDPKGPEKGKRRVIRGGSYCSDENICHVSNRQHWYPGKKIVVQGIQGFRLAYTEK